MQAYLAMYALRAAREVVHPAGEAVVQPAVERVGRIRRSEGGNTREIESHGEGVRLGELRQLGRRARHRLGAQESVDHGPRTAQRA